MSIGLLLKEIITETVNSFDIFIVLIKACQNNDEYPHVYGPNGYEAAMGSPKHLLGQRLGNYGTEKGISV